MSASAKRLAFIALTISVSASAEALKVDWPENWQREDVPAPDSPFEANVQGERERAFRLQPNGEQAVVAELTRLPLPTQQEVTLDRVLREMRQGVQLGFAQSGLQTACKPPEDTHLGNLPAREVSCTATQAGRPVLQQSLLMARSDTAVYSMTFAMPADQAETVADEIKQVREGLKLP